MRLKLYPVLFLGLALNSFCLGATMLAEDNFENYKLGSWPTFWSKDGNANNDLLKNKIVQDPANSSNKVLKLHGRVGGCWGAFGYYPCDFVEDFYVVVRVRNGSETLSGCHPSRAGFGMRHGTYGNSDTNPCFEFVQFTKNAITCGDGKTILMSSYQVNRWYKLKVHYERSGNQVRLSYWVDGQYLGQKSFIVNLNEHLTLDHFEISAAEGTVFFDKFKIHTDMSFPDEWSFVQMTDAHVGWNGNWAENRMTDAICEINQMVPKPELILITGDIAEYAYVQDPITSEKRYIDSYGRFLDSLESLDAGLKNQVYIVPGNHDRWTNLWKPENLESYNYYINPKLPQTVQTIFSANDYSFEYKGLLFIGLDSGDGGPLGTGLSDEQMNALKNPYIIQKQFPKIVFMHHPGLSDDDWQIGTNQDKFVTYCKNNNVQIVLAGHSHADKIFGADGSKLRTGSILYPEFIQTPSAVKDDNVLHGYRKIRVVNNKARPETYSATKNHNRISCEMSSQANAHVYDRQGRHVGIDGAGNPERNIFNSFYFHRGNQSQSSRGTALSEKIIIHEPYDNYIWTIAGKEKGNYRMVLTSTENGYDTVFQANGIPTLPGAIHQYVVNWNLVKAGLAGVTIYIDADGDGNSERTILSDRYFTTDEFDAPMRLTILSPLKDQAVKGGITLTADASDADGTADVKFFVREPNQGSGIPIGKEYLTGTFNSASGKWQCNFDTTELEDGYYVVFAKGTDIYGNVYWSQAAAFSIRNWTIVPRLAASAYNKSGRMMPVKFSLRIDYVVNSRMPFIYNDKLEIRIYDKAKPNEILQRSIFGYGLTDYRIDLISGMYQTNFKTGTNPAIYIVEIWMPAKNLKVGSFSFATTK